MSQKKLLAIAFIILAFGLTSCCRKQEESKDILRVAISHDPMSLDPRQVFLSKDVSIAKALYEGLFRENGNVPDLALAENYQLSQDGCTYTFFLKKTFWNNGDPVTAYDFEESIKQIYSQEIDCVTLRSLALIKNSHAVLTRKLPVKELGVHALNEHTLEITLERPCSHFVEVLTHPIFYPVHASLREYYKNKRLIRSFPIISNGPFMISHYEPQHFLLLNKNPLYYDQKNVSLSTIRLQIISDIHTATQMFQKKLIDLIGLPWTSSFPLEEQQVLDPENLCNYPVLNCSVLFCNMNNKPFNNPLLRAAFSLAINRETLLKIAGKGSVASSFVHPRLSQVPPQILSLTERTTLARMYLTEALKTLSEEDLEKIILIYPVESLCLRAVVQEIRQQLFDILGIKIVTLGLEYHCFLDKRSRGDFALATGNWIADYHQASAFLSVLGDGMKYKDFQLIRWQNEEYTNIVAQLLIKDSQDLQMIAEQLLLKENPIIPLYHLDYVYAKHSRVANLQTSSFGEVDLKKVSLIEQ
ncbi:peptide ABC transporter substrate-binding protein [Chlamydia sp.]|uniref:peptide ABC transporter substrate-binding protein n=1 Tax=Chlamydia sp. TaxID=35827 RepID=UPI0025BCFA9A|nr:peptide ABC transporter substrate-binding protein [Chlamydia sp.]MBQ8498389.1 peptide ABC transporter substrate-binding protein [Chlamydia sp.]